MLLLSLNSKHLIAKLVYKKISSIAHCKKIRSLGLFLTADLSHTLFIIDIAISGSVFVNDNMISAAKII